MELIPDLPPEALTESPPQLPAKKPAGPRLGSALLVSVIFYAVTFGVTIPIVIVGHGLSRNPEDEWTRGGGVERCTGIVRKPLKKRFESTRHWLEPIKCL